MVRRLARAQAAGDAENVTRGVADRQRDELEPRTFRSIRLIPRARLVVHVLQFHDQSCIKALKNLGTGNKPVPGYPLGMLSDRCKASRRQEQCKLLRPPSPPFGAYWSVRTMTALASGIT